MQEIGTAKSAYLVSLVLKHMRAQGADDKPPDLLKNITVACMVLYEQL